MMKILWLIVLASLACRLLAGRWPWQLFIKSARSPGSEQARNLLGVRHDATREEIIEAHRRLVAMVHPDRGGTNEQVHEANNARDLLLADIAPRPTERP